MYGNEAEVGRAVAAFEAETGEHVFITTKVWRIAYDYSACVESVKTSLEHLRHLDLVLLHAPGEPAGRAEAWRALEQCKADGLVANIGVSNFSAAHLQKLMASASEMPAVNQLEVHPFLQRTELVNYCKQHGIVVEAYSPLAKASELDDPTLNAVAQELGVTVAQVMLRWSLQKGCVPLPKSVHAERQKANLDVFGFHLSDEQMARLDALEKGVPTGWDPVTQDPV